MPASAARAAGKSMLEKDGRTNDVHFGPEGCEVLAKAVSKSIKAALAKK